MASTTFSKPIDDEIKTLNSKLTSTGVVDVSAGKTYHFGYACRPRCYAPLGNVSYEYVQFPFVAKNTNYTVSIAACTIAEVGQLTPTVAFKYKDAIIISWPTTDLVHMCNAGVRDGTITFA